MYGTRVSLGGAWGAKAPPPKFYCVQARKLLEAAVQVQSFIYGCGIMNWKESEKLSLELKSIPLR